MATIKDIAKKAGVSISTVSHVLNKTRFVSESLSNKVKKIAIELNYSPSAIARSLKKNETKTIGVIFDRNTNPYFAELLSAVDKRAYENGYSIIISNFESEHKRFEFNLNTLMQKKVDGLLLFGSEINSYPLSCLEQYSKTPMVFMDIDISVKNHLVDQILSNSVYGAYKATDYLIACGHKKIGCISGNMSSKVNRDRFKGYQKALEKAGLIVNKNYIFEGNFDCRSGQDCFEKFMRLPRNNRPTALFIFNDLMAMGFMNKAYSRGLTIPDDISIIGYDNIEYSEFLNPALTTIHQPKYELGIQSVDLLMQRIKDPKLDTQVFQLKPDLIKRNSVRLLDQKGR